MPARSRPPAVRAGRSGNDDECQYSAISCPTPPRPSEHVGRRALTVEQRRAEILEATRRVVLERGFGHTRVADVAAELGISTGLIHYHFASKDELLAETLRVTAATDIRRLEEVVAASGDPIEKLDRVMQEFLPSEERDHSWVL